MLAGLLTLGLAACSAAGASSASDDVNPPEMEAEPEIGAPDSAQEVTGMDETKFYLTIGDAVFTASPADNSGARALKELLSEGDMTLKMSDYGGFEKVGPLGTSLPTENVQTTTQAGDIVLYRGNQIVLFYGSNSWSYTRLGHVDDLTGWEEVLGSGDVSVTLSLTVPQI